MIACSKMSFVDLATLTMHRRAELDARICSFTDKCDEAAANLNQLKLLARSFPQSLNCDPMELKDHFLNSMKQLDEFMYLVMDFNLAVANIVDNSSSIPETITPDHGSVRQVIQPVPSHLLDILSDRLPSTAEATSSTLIAAANIQLAPKKERKTKKKAVNPELLIAFSSGSCSQESVANRNENLQTAGAPNTTLQGANEGASSQDSMVNVSLNLDNEQNSRQDPVQERVSSPTEYTRVTLPGQSVLQLEHVYPATVMHVDGGSLWIVIEHDEAYELMTGMTEYYMKTRRPRKSWMSSRLIAMIETGEMHFCAYYDNETKCYYRAFVLKVVEPKQAEDDDSEVELFLVDTGDSRVARVASILPLLQRFCEKPPFARLCYLAGVDLKEKSNDKDLMERQEKFLKEYTGESCQMQVDDNSSESLGVFLTLSNGDLLNYIVINEGLADPETSITGQEVSPSAEMATASAPVVSTDALETSASALVTSASTPVTSAAGATMTSSARAHFTPSRGPPEILDDADFDYDDIPEFDDPLEAVTGYHNRDEKDICMHYKGGPEKSCFKGARCKKRHVMKHPDGWTLDKVPVAGKGTTVPLPAPDSWLTVRVTHVCSFNRLFVQIVDKDTRKPDTTHKYGVVMPPMTFEKLVQEMNTDAGIASHRPLKLAPAVGELVAALYPPDMRWYRARVLTHVVAEQSVEVHYVDYGNDVWVKEDHIRSLGPLFHALPHCAVRCRVAGVQSPDGSDPAVLLPAKRALQDKVQDRTVSAHVVSRDYDELEVELFDCEGFSVGQMLAAMKLVKLGPFEVQKDDGRARRIVLP